MRLCHEESIITRRLSSSERELYRAATGRPPPPCLVQRWHWWVPPFRGLALTWLILVRDDRDPALVCHEVEHVAQWCAHPLTFWLRYVRELAYVGYRDNRYEQAARQVGQRVSVLMHMPNGSSSARHLARHVCVPKWSQIITARLDRERAMRTIRESIELDVSADTACAQWLQRDEFPRLLGPLNLRDRAIAELRTEHDADEWDSETIERRPDKLVLWKSDPRRAAESTAEFASISERESRITVSITLDARRPEFDRQVSRHLHEELTHFKRFVEGRARRR